MCPGAAGEERHQGVATVGVRPSFEIAGQRLVEVYILDFDEDIYGCDLVVEFVEEFVKLILISF